MTRSRKGDLVRAMLREEATGSELGDGASAVRSSPSRRRVGECLRQRMARYCNLGCEMSGNQKGAEKEWSMSNMPLWRHGRKECQTTPLHVHDSVRLYVPRLALGAIDQVRPWYGVERTGVPIPVTRTVPRCMCVWITQCRQGATAPASMIWRIRSIYGVSTEYLEAAQARRRDRAEWSFPSIALPN